MRRSSIRQEDPRFERFYVLRGRRNVLAVSEFTGITVLGEADERQLMDVPARVQKGTDAGLLDVCEL